MELAVLCGIPQVPAINDEPKERIEDEKDCLLRSGVSGACCAMILVFNPMASAIELLRRKDVVGESFGIETTESDTSIAGILRSLD